MIDKIYIESARSIIAEGKKLNEKFNEHSDDYKRLSDKFKKTSEDIEKFCKNELHKIKNKNDAETMLSGLFKILEETSTEEKKIQRLITPLIEKIEKLKQEEKIVFDALKDKYTTMSIDDIVKEIHNNLEKWFIER